MPPKDLDCKLGAASVGVNSFLGGEVDLDGQYLINMGQSQIGLGGYVGGDSQWSTYNVNQSGASGTSYASASGAYLTLGLSASYIYNFTKNFSMELTGKYGFYQTQIDRSPSWSMPQAGTTNNTQVSTSNNTQILNPVRIYAGFTGHW